MFSVNWVQYAVGHGGFHSGQMSASDGAVFRWIFDCGSRRTQKFNIFLQTWTDHYQQPVDWLFISHFDTDHVSGLDTLMSRTVVRDVMVPYVNERELAYLLLYEIGRGNLNRAFVELVADPATFFLSRGADRVTFLHGRRPGDEPIEGGPRPDRPKDEQGWTTKIDPQPQPLQAPVWTTSINGARVRMIGGGKCDISIARGQVGLRLKPYRAPIKPYAHRGLIKALQAQFGTIPWKKMRPGLGDLAYAIAHHARTAKGRSDLRTIFKSYAGSSNRSSLSLLSIPDVANASIGRWKVVRSFGHSLGPGEAAWLNTGDAELLDSGDLKDWEATYAPELGSVRVLALPHHGSDKNSDDALQRLCPQAVLTVHVKSGAKKHPGSNVTVAAGHRLACVTEQPGSQVQMWFYTL
ncbi:MAG TPA: MBL fold metallo-hydrolase [Beijerinckiaceae bacterium]|jgi:hypothetical protein